MYLKRNRATNHISELTYRLDTITIKEKNHFGNQVNLIFGKLLSLFGRIKIEFYIFYFCLQIQFIKMRIFLVEPLKHFSLDSLTA